MLTKFVAISKVICLLSLSVLLISGAYFFYETQKVVKQVPQIAQNEMQATRVLLKEQIDALRTETLGEVNKIHTGLNSSVIKIVDVADNRLGAIQKDTFSQVDTLNKTVDRQLSETNKSVNTLITAYADIPKTVGARFEPFTNCEANGLCWQNQASDALLAIRTSSRATSEAMGSITTTMPQIATNINVASSAFATDFPKITGNITSITGNINRLTTPKWYDRLLGYALNGVVIYRNMNPATNLTIKGSQAVAGAGIGALTK